MSELQKRASAFFGLKNELRQAVLQSWATVSKAQSRLSIAGNSDFGLARFVEYVVEYFYMQEKISPFWVEKFRRRERNFFGSLSCLGRVFLGSF
jgi:hypothetical protein